MSDYSRFLIPFWRVREKEIEDSVKFNDDGSCDIWSNPHIIHAMISEDGPIGNSIRLLRYLRAWHMETGINIQDIQSTIEFGGGFGAMAKQVSFFNQNPYSIIDLPVMAKIQRHFLRNEPHVKNYPMNVFESVLDFKCDLFISTFALSESSEECIQKVLDNGFFGAKHLLMVFAKDDYDDFHIEKFLPTLRTYKGFAPIDENKYYRIFN
jgi:hypothetical protein